MHKSAVTHTLLAFFMVFAFSLAGAAAVYAQSIFDDDAEVLEEDGESEANRFFKDCMENPIFNVSDETNLENCACASAQVAIWEQNLAENMVSQDFLTPAQQRDELTEEVLMLDVYAPCLYIPAREMLYDECALDSYSQYSAHGKQDRLEYICTCISNDLANYYEYAADAFLELRHANGYTIYNPFKEVQKSSEYLLQKRETEKRCYNDYYGQLRNAK